MDFLTIAGYLIAALAIALGLYLLLRKNAEKDNSEDQDTDNTRTPDLDSDLIDDDPLEDGDSSRIPVVPRHVRNYQPTESVSNAPSVQSNQAKASDSIEVFAPNHSSQHETRFGDDDDEDILEQTAQIKPATARVETSESEIQEQFDIQQSQHLADSSKPDSEPVEDAFDQVLAQLEAATTDIEDDVDHKASAYNSTGLNKPVETADVQEWQGESALLEAHIEDQDRRDDESALAQAEQVISLYVMPSPSRALSGERTIHLLRQFGLRYGEMSLFHRFQDSDGTGPLMFSVLRYTSEGPSGFDLETLPTEQVEGLAFFLALPGKHAVAGYDTMVSISTLLAREVAGQVYDEHMNQLSPQLRDHYRNVVLEYRSPQ